MDNTLVRSNNLHLYAFKKAIAKHKLPRKTNKEILKVFSLQSEILIKELYPNLTKKEIQNVVNTHDKIVVKEPERIKPIRGAKGVLRKLKKHYKIALLSNCKHKEILAILKSAKIDKNLFEAIIGNDDVKHGKPSPDEIIKAKKILKVKKGYMVGDSIYDIQAGKKAKLKTIAVCTGNHSKKELRKEKPYKILDSIADLPKLLIHPK